MSAATDAYDVSLVIACYGDADHLFRNVSRLARLFEVSRLTAEFILVEDASPYGDAAEVRRCVEQLDGRPMAVRAIFHERNRGRGRTVQDGFEAARGTVVAYIDVDLEHSPDALFPMILDCLDGVADGVVGMRVLGDGAASIVRRVLSGGYRRLVHSVLKLAVADSEAGIKVFRRAALLPVLPKLRDEAWFWDTELVYRAGEAGLRLAEREVVFRRDDAKKSTVRLFRDSCIYLLTLARFARTVRLEAAWSPEKRRSRG